MPFVIVLFKYKLLEFKKINFVLVDLKTDTKHLFATILYENQLIVTDKLMRFTTCKLSFPNLRMGRANLSSSAEIFPFPSRSKTLKASRNMSFWSGPIVRVSILSSISLMNSSNSTTPFSFLSND